MVCINGEIVTSSEGQIPFNNRGTYYGDALFETIRCHNGKTLFFEAHYFRLMSSMRILRMEIPAEFTPEYLEQQVLNILQENELEKHARVRITVWRSHGGYYTPTAQSIEFAIEASELAGVFSFQDSYEVELFKDHYLNTGLLSTLKTANKLPNILAGIYAKENGYDDMLLLNHNKMVVEAISGNLFLRKGNDIKTPPLIDGCLNGIMREQVISQIKRMINYTITEESITPFELQRADELFLTNTVKGVTKISKYRKKEFTSTTAEELVEIFNQKLF